MKPELIVVFCIYLGFVLSEILFTNFFRKPKQKSSDAIVEVVSGSILALFTQPLTMVGGFAIAAYFMPRADGVLESWPFLAVFALFLVFDDLTQYWWHRMSHTVPWLYKLHRPHHNAEYLSIRIVYRNNIFYYALMPGLWLSGAMIFLGGGWVYAVYLVIKMTIIYGAHSDIRWDKPLYKIKALSPIMWVVERVISTPATHSAHHGKFSADGITNYHGNYGNLLFLWDVIFGTAKITRRYPKEFGVENLPETSVAEQLVWPIAGAPNQVVASTE